MGRPTTLIQFPWKDNTMPFYKGPAGFERVMNLFINFIITIAFDTYILYMAQQAVPQAPIFTPLNWIVSFIPGYAVACFIGTYVPVTNWANAAASKTKSKAASAIVTALVYDFAFVTMLTIILCWVNNIQTLGLEGTFFAWLQLYPVALIACFFIILIILPIGMSLAAKVSGFDPRKLQSAPGESVGTEAGARAA